MLGVPSRSAFSHPNRLAALLSLSVKLGPVIAGNQFSPARTHRRAFRQKVHAGRDSCGTCISSDPSGYLWQAHVLTLFEPSAAHLRLCSLIARCPFSRPITTGGSSDGSSSIFSRRSCLAVGGHSDSTPNGNARRAQTACAKASDGGFLPAILTNGLRVTAGSGASCCLGRCFRLPFVADSHWLYPKRMRAFSR